MTKKHATTNIYTFKVYPAGGSREVYRVIKIDEKVISMGDSDGFRQELIVAVNLI